MSIKIVATCPNELRQIMENDLERLGFSDICQGFRSVEAVGDETSFYRAHLHLPAASQIFRIIREGSAKSPNMLFSQAKRVKWHKLFSLNTTYRVDGIAGDRGEDAMPSDFISKKVRQGIEDDFQHHLGKMPTVDVKEPKVIVTAMVREQRVILSIRTSGMSLHKRGYRVEGHPAPLKETLAYAMCQLAGYDGSQPLLDPMCGSGTIGIEAAMIALKKSPLIHRKKNLFGFEHLLDFNRQLWRDIQETARSERAEQLPQSIYLTDIEQKYIDLAQQNSLKARVEKHLEFRCGSFFELDPPTDTPGILISNLPYGERLDHGCDEMDQFYKQIGDKLKQSYAGWQAWFLVNEKSPWKKIGLKPKRKISLLNGSIQVKLLGYDLY